MPTDAPAGTPAAHPRAAWVDAARCLAMYVIMWLHSGAAPSCISDPVGGAIGLFFVLAGYFLPQRASRTAVRALRLALAWLLWSLVSWGLFCVCAPEQEWTWEQVFGWGVAAYNTPLWFLRNLFVYQLVFAALQALGVLPRYKWLWLVLLMGMSYAGSPAQHESLRFGWMMATALGYCLQGESLESLHDRMLRNALPLALLAVFLLLQVNYYPGWLRAHGMGVQHCGLPLLQLSWTLLYLLAAAALDKWVPRVAAVLALAGPGMIFCYAAHSYLCAPLYVLDVRVAGGFWFPLLAMPLLTLLYRAGMRGCPRIFRYLCAR